MVKITPLGVEGVPGRVKLTPSPLSPLPSLVTHADWGSSPKKRWMARADLEGGRYRAFPPEPVGETWSLLARLQAESKDGGVFLGFDFPIGLPLGYAQRAGITDFLQLLPELGEGRWFDFYRPAEQPEQVCLGRPFYPRRPGGARLSQLLEGLGLESAAELRRLCERARPGRRAAAPLFWTIGGQQVGKAAIAGWQEVLAPALRTEAPPVSIWPFSGKLACLLAPGRIVIAETYPAEVYTHLGFRFSRRGAGGRSGKRVQGDRARNAPQLLAWAGRCQVILEPELQSMILEGFGPAADGEDRFDACTGLFGMLNVLLGYQPAGEPEREETRRIEGWILGQVAPVSG